MTHSPLSSVNVSSEKDSRKIEKVDRRLKTNHYSRCVVWINIVKYVYRMCPSVLFYDKQDMKDHEMRERNVVSVDAIEENRLRMFDHRTRDPVRHNVTNSD